MTLSGGRVIQLMKECKQSILKLTGMVPPLFHVHVLACAHVHVAGVTEIDNEVNVGK